MMDKISTVDQVKEFRRIYNLALYNLLSVKLDELAEKAQKLIGDE